MLIHSSVMQLLFFLDEVANSFDFDDNIHVVYTEYETVTDNVDYRILMKKLYTMGVWGKAFKLFRSYIANWTQCAKCDETFSQEVLVTSGVYRCQSTLRSSYQLPAKQLWDVPTIVMRSRCEVCFE